MIYLDGKLTKPDAERVAILKEVFPSFFSKEKKPVFIRNTAGNSHKAKVGRLGGSMKLVDRPNSGMMVTMRAQYQDDEYQMHELHVSLRPARVDKNNQLDFGKNDRIMVEHGTMITDSDVLYFMYFFYPNMANGQCEKKVQAPRFEFSMPDVERTAKISDAMDESRVLSAITSGLSDVSVADILRKLNAALSEDVSENRVTLLQLFRTNKRKEVTTIIDAVLAVTEEEGNTQKIDIEAVVREAINSDKIKIEEGKLYIRKKDGEYSSKADKMLVGEDEDERFLDAVTFFAGNESKLKQIV